MMSDERFRHRSARVISLGRVFLASVFLLAVWLDPLQPTRAPAIAYAILAVYLIVAIAQLAATWNSWWREAWLAGPAHVIDILVFSVMVFLTEGYTSPFFTFFVFLLLSATIRWGWRETAMTAAAVILVFIVAGFAALQWGEAEFDLRRLLIRSAYLAVLSLILIWFGNRHQPARAARMPAFELNASEASTRLPVAPALEYARARTAADRVFLAWWDQEEPWTNLSALDGGKLRTSRFGPGEMDELVHPDLLGKPFIFDLEKNRVIAGRPTGRSVVVPPISPKLISHMGVSSGLAIPVETADFGGLVVVDGVPGLCSDHLAIAADVGREISAALERCSVLRASEDNAAARTRLALARDLHDSFVQILAGTSFRLEAIRQNAQSGKDVLGHIEGLQSVLSQQQRELRVLISQLRGEERASEKTDTQPGLRELAERLSRQWGLTCTVDCLGQVRPLPTAMQHEIHQLFRETVANAARHGKAAEVHLTLNIDSDFISLVVKDNGCGFPGAARGGDGDTHVELAAPRSLSERVRGAGGDIRVSSGPTGSTVTVRLPLERRV